MKNLVSVLMCVYNTPEEYLIEAIDSILGQTYEYFEFVIVDDCSTDPIVSKCLDKYKRIDSRIIVIRNLQNEGLTKSLNIGLMACRGEYIARMDSDDVSLSDRIRKEVEFLNSNLDVALVGCNIICFGENRDEVDTSTLSNPCDDPSTYRIRSLLQHSGPPHPTFLFRASFLKEHNISYREEIEKAQDYGIMADILKAGGTIKKIHEPLLRYREHDKQITTNSELDQKLYQLRVSYDYVREVFPELSDAEGFSISLLGCIYSLEEISEILSINKKLANVLKVYIDNVCALHKSSTYISALKKVIKYNKQRKEFDVWKLETEFRYRWWKYALHRSKTLKHPWGMGFYTIYSYWFSFLCYKNKY